MTDRFLITIMLPKDIAEEVSIIQEQLRVPSWPKNIEPHVTLFPPFTHRSTIPEINALLEKVAHTFDPFQITLSGVGSFRPKTSTIFIKVGQQESLMRLQRAISQALKPIANRLPSNPHDFHPHVTISNKLKPETFKRQLLEMKEVTIDYTFSCDRFSLMQLDRGKWKVIQEFVFNK